MIREWFKSLARRILSKELAVLREALEEQTRQNVYLSNTPQVKYVLTRQVFTKQIKERIEQPYIVNNATAEYSAYLLGIQRALAVVEKELVSD